MSADYGVDALDRAMYDTAHEYVHPVTKKKGCAAVASVLGMPASTVFNKANPHELTSNFSVKEARSLMLATGDHRILHQLANDVGEACFPLPVMDFPADSDWMMAWTDWQLDVAMTVKALKEAFDDNKISQSEIAKIRKELILDFEKGLGMLDVLKGMAEPEVNVVAIKRS